MAANFSEKPFQQGANYFITGSTGLLGKLVSETFSNNCIAAVSGYRFVIPEPSEYLHPSFCDLSNKGCKPLALQKLNSRGTGRKSLLIN